MFPLFARLQISRREWLASRLVISNFGAGVEIVPAHDKATDVYFVLQGQVRAKNYSHDGKEFIYSEIGPGEFFGEFSALDGQPRSSAITAVSSCMVAKLNAKHFRELLEAEPAFSLTVMCILVQKVRSLTSRLMAMAASNMPQRLRMELIRLSATGTRTGSRITICPAPTHYEIAAHIGSHREAITKALNKFESDGHILVKRAKITILDAENFCGQEFQLDQ